MQNKPFHITHAMRETVATQLTIQAVAKHGPRIAADIKALNDQFWAQHREKAAALPGLDSLHWAELIQQGALSACANCEVHYLKPQKDDSEPRQTQFIAVEKHYKAEARNTLITRVLDSTAFEVVSNYLDKPRWDGHWVIRLKSPHGSVPRLHGMQVITDPALESLALMICADLAAVVDAALAFREEVMSVLLACRTSRQVDDLLPEAAKLLPQPVKNEKALAPTELAASVRSMLNKGVPPVTNGEQGQ